MSPTKSVHSATNSPKMSQKSIQKKQEYKKTLVNSSSMKKINFSSEQDQKKYFKSDEKTSTPHTRGLLHKATSFSHSKEVAKTGLHIPKQDRLINNRNSLGNQLISTTQGLESPSNQPKKSTFARESTGTRNRPGSAYTLPQTFSTSGSPKKKISEQAARVKVLIRVRPLSQAESSLMKNNVGYICCKESDNNTLHFEEEKQTFQFDFVIIYLRSYE